MGLCGWHMEGVKVKVQTHSDVTSVKEAVDAGRARVAVEFLTFAVAGLGQSGYHARAIEGMPVSKSTDMQKQLDMLLGIINCW